MSLLSLPNDQVVQEVLNIAHSQGGTVGDQALLVLKVFLTRLEEHLMFDKAENLVNGVDNSNFVLPETFNLFSIKRGNHYFNLELT